MIQRRGTGSLGRCMLCSTMRKTMMLMIATTMMMMMLTVSDGGVTVKGKPNVTVKQALCNSQMYVPGTPFDRNVQYVLSDILHKADAETAKGKPLSYRNISPEPTDFVYGEGSCAVGPPDCASCLVNATSVLSQTCSRAQGARVQLVDCSIRYEAYPFSSISS